jgi:hypothetical protein
MLFRLGLVAVVLSFVPWLAIAAAPLFGLSLGASAGLAAGLAVAAEVLFWAGLALVGKDTWQAIRARGWRRAPRELGRLLVHGRPAPATGTSDAAPVERGPSRRP